MAGPEDATVASLRRASGELAREAVRRLEEGMPWYRALSAADRSWVGLVAQAGISAFISWYSEPEEVAALSADVFGTAPRELTRSISLQHTLDIVRTVIATVEENVPQIVEQQELREAVLRYSRDVAFAAAQVYARSAESRGNWDARLEALVIDGILRDSRDVDELRSWAAALRWGESSRLVVVAGRARRGSEQEMVAALRRAARAAGGDVLIGVQGERLVLVIGHDSDPVKMVDDLLLHFDDGPVVIGPTVGGLAQAGESARVALAGLAAAPGRPDVPRPAPAGELLPERALNGDAVAAAQLREEIYRPLAEDSGALLETVSRYLELGGSLEGTARVLFVHPNTVRYRLRKVSELTGWDPTDARSAFVLRVGIIAGRQGAVRTS